MSAGILREAAAQLRVDVKVAVDRGHMSFREGNYNRAVADWLDSEADDRAARVYLDPMDDALSDEAVAAARAYLGRDA